MANVISMKFGPLIRTAVRSGEKHRNVCTSSVVLQKEDDAARCMKSECGKRIPDTEFISCERVCMPCCKPARFPPECYFPFEKPVCTVLKPPRPAYSECVKEPIYEIRPCDCCYAPPPKCNLLKVRTEKKC